MKLVSKVGQIRVKLGKVITAPSKTGARTPMKRLDIGVLKKKGVNCLYTLKTCM